MRKLILLFFISTAIAQTHTYPALDTNNVFTGLNTFNGGITAGSSPGIDPAVWLESYNKIGITDAKPNVNVYGFTTQLLINPSGSSSTAFQKAAIFGECQHNDSTATVNPRDCIGVQGYGIIQAGNTNGRVWGMANVASVATGGDGNAVGIESDIQNYGSDPGTSFLPSWPTNGKYAYTAASIGANKALAAYVVDKFGSGGWHYGLMMPGAIDTAAIVVPNNIPSISSINAAGTGIIDMIHLDSSNNLQLGSGLTGSQEIIVPSVILQTNFDLKLARHLTQTTTGNIAGTCNMSASTSCTFSITAGYGSTPICIVTPQGATAIAGACSFSGTTVTITAASSNSLTWGALLIGNPQ